MPAIFRLRLAALALAGLGSLAGLGFPAPQAAAQSVTNTLRYGTGLLDVPTAKVAPHLSLTGAYSGFGISVANRIVLDRSGREIAKGEAYDKWVSDGAITFGLFDRIELGATIQHYDDPANGGNLLGGFGRVLLLSQGKGFNVAVGARYVSSPSFGDQYPDEFQPNRFGYPDSRVVKNPSGRAEFSANFTPYAVATFHLPGLEASFLPEYDFSLTAGWGGGMFGAGSDLDFYGASDAAGLLAGAALHLSIGDGKLLHLMGEFNGFDLNTGVELDWGGVRVGAFVLGMEYADQSMFRSRKIGLTGSVAFCGGDGGLCKPSLSDRPAPDTVTLPAPPPDTVFVDRTVEPPLPTGTPAAICLSTGAAVQVVVTPQLDTLVGPNRVSIRNLRPGIVFAGVYAEERTWFVDDEAIELERRAFSKSGNPRSLNCNDIMRVGEYEGVPLFAERSAERPLEMIFVPVRPGVWQAYEYGLQGTRG